MELVGEDADRSRDLDAPAWRRTKALTVRALRSTPRERGAIVGAQPVPAHYRNPEPFRGQAVLVVGGGNSGAQTSLSVAHCIHNLGDTDATLFLPDNVNGRVLFQLDRSRGEEADEGASTVGSRRAAVREARDRGIMDSVRPFAQFTGTGVVCDDETEIRVDAVIWCTGFRPALNHLCDLGIITSDGLIEIDGNRAVREPRLWLIGYGDWTGFTSATLVCAARTSRDLARTPLASLDAESIEAT